MASAAAILRRLEGFPSPTSHSKFDGIEIETNFVAICRHYHKPDRSQQLAPVQMPVHPPDYTVEQDCGASLTPATCALLIHVRRRILHRHSACTPTNPGSIA